MTRNILIEFSYSPILFNGPAYDDKGRFVGWCVYEIEDGVFKQKAPPAQEIIEED